MSNRLDEMNDIYTEMLNRFNNILTAKKMGLFKTQEIEDRVCKKNRDISDSECEKINNILGNNP